MAERAKCNSNVCKEDETDEENDPLAVWYGLDERVCWRAEVMSVLVFDVSERRHLHNVVEQLDIGRDAAGVDRKEQKSGIGYNSLDVALVEDICVLATSDLIELGVFPCAVRRRNLWCLCRRSPRRSRRWRWSADSRRLGDSSNRHGGGVVLLLS